MAENYTIETDIIYEGNGAVKEFPITFSFSNENEVVVYLNGEVIRRGYSIDGDSVVFNVAPADGDEIALAKAAVDAPEEEENTSGESSESGSNTVYDQASREHIKINPVPAKVKYSGNGEVTEFPTGFAFFENDNIVVYLNGVIIDGGYSVTGVGETDGGSVIFEEAPKEGDKIVILRQVAIERVTDFQEGGAFRAKNINDELDRQTAFCQQIQEQIDRCVKVEVTEDQTPEELLAEVYGKLDSATEVAQNAVDAATAATEAVASAEKTLAEVTTYVDESKAEIGALITKTTEEIDQTISDATEEIKEVAVNAANEAVQETIGASVIEAATSAEHARIWAEGEQAEVKPLGGELSSMGAADLAYALANAPEDTPIDASGLFAMNVVKGEKGDKGDKGEDGKEFDALNFLNLIYPVGSIYISTTSTCPIQDFGIGTWELVAADRVLQGAGTRGAVGTQLAESLPQHTHTRGSMEISGTLGASGNKVAIGNAQNTNLGVSGVFTQSNRENWLGYAGGGGGYSQGCTVTFTASRNWTGSTSNASGSTYQSNAKVQQDAYLVNIFRRVA